MGTITHIKSEAMGKTYSNLTIYKTQTTKRIKALRAEIEHIQEGIDRQEKADWRKVALYLGDPAKPILRSLRIELNELKAERSRIIDPIRHEQRFNEAKIANQELNVRELGIILLNGEESKELKEKHVVIIEELVNIGSIPLLGYCVLEGLHNGDNFRVTAKCVRKSPSYKFVLEPIN